MRLACRLGFHRPVLPGLWNAGCWFSRCRRCRRDLVRAPGGRWRVPRGFRVVWKTPSEAALGILLRDVGQAPGPAAGPRRTHVPLQAVLRRLHHSDFMNEESRRGSWDGEIEISIGDALRRIDRSDFMTPRRGDVAGGGAQRETPLRETHPPLRPPNRSH